MAGRRIFARSLLCIAERVCFSPLAHFIEAATVHLFEDLNCFTSLDNPLRSLPKVLIAGLKLGRDLGSFTAIYLADALWNNIKLTVFSGLFCMTVNLRQTSLTHRLCDH